MDMKEFGARFISCTEKSVLFDALRRLSLMSDLKSLTLGEAGWGEWPDPTDPTDPGGPGGGQCAWAGRI